MAIQLRLDVAQLTDVGRKREHNEDNMAYVIPKDPQVMAMKGALFIVADGMGGHAAGEVASEIAVDSVSNAYYMDDNEDVATPLLQAIKRANTAIYQRAAENMLRSGMGTTCVAAVLRGNMSYIANVGDSRAYLVRGNQVRQVSQDHSWVAEQVRAGLLTEEQARTHAQRNVITRCLGTQPDVEVDVFREPLQEGDCLILCSDGLSGLVSDEELLRIVEQSVPQESVYHLVERANENGGPDNITAIVVRVHELGVEPPGVRNPVPVGGREIGQEDTGAINMLGAAATPYTVGNVDGRVVSAPLHLSSGPLVSPESITAPQPALGKQQRNRLFFPTLLLLFLIVVALAGGGFFYIVHNNESQAIDSALNTAGQLIIRAQGEVSSNPSQALKDLASVQNNLRDLQKNHTLDGNQTNKLNMLQGQMATQVKAAIGSYNTGAKIAVVPCNGTTSHPINTTSTNIQPSSIVAVQSGNGSTVLFALGPDGVVYQVTNQYGLLPVMAKTPSASAFAIASNGTQLFTLAKQLQGATNLPNPNGYSVNMYALDQTGKSLSKPVTAVIGQTFTTGGYAPTLITSWKNNIYVVLTITNQNKARILAFTPDNKGHLVPAKPYDFSNSQPIMSVAAFADQFFLLLSNGAVQSLSLAGAFGNQSQSTFPTAVQAKSPIEMPLPTSASNYTPTMGVPTVTPLPQSGSTSLLTLLISTANTLSVGVVNTVSHLYIGDSTNHRVLDLQEAAPPPAGTGTGKSITMQLVQQYVSSQELNVVKSLAVDPQGANLNILAQPGNTSPVHLVSVSTAPMQTACSM